MHRAQCTIHPRTYYVISLVSFLSSYITSEVKCLFKFKYFAAVVLLKPPGRRWHIGKVSGSHIFLTKPLLYWPRGQGGGGAATIRNLYKTAGASTARNIFEKLANLYFDAGACTQMCFISARRWIKVKRVFEQWISWRNSSLCIAENGSCRMRWIISRDEPAATGCGPKVFKSCFSHMPNLKRNLEKFDFACEKKA